MQGPSPAARDSAEVVPASYWMSARSMVPSERCRDVWSRTLPARHRPRELIVSAPMHLLSHRLHLAVAHALVVVRSFEAHGAVQDHDRAKMLHADVGHSAIVRRIGALVRHAHR